MSDRLPACTAFAGARRIASGDLETVAVAAKDAIDRGEQAPVLIFDDTTGQIVEVDFRGTAEDVRARVARETQPPRGPGRPKLGVVAREVTLLPRHWDWLNSQPGGASVALRKLVDQARHANEGKDRVRRAQEAAYRFMTAMAGDRPGFEEATRALFANDRARFAALSQSWPVAIRDHARKLAAAAFEAESNDARAEPGRLDA